MKEFLSQFQFRPELAGYIGVEREHFLVNSDNLYVPEAERFLAQVDNVVWTNELSACQVESRTLPVLRVNELEHELLRHDMTGKIAARNIRLRLVNKEVAPNDIPLDVYPDPRYIKIAKQIPASILRAACRVAGTHIHLGVPNIDVAIRVHNKMVKILEALCMMGDNSNGERLQLYKLMAKHWKPPIYENPEHFYEIARAEGFAENPRNCWYLIRISRHGTVELRMFGATDSIPTILSWVKFVRARAGKLKQ